MVINKCLLNLLLNIFPLIGFINLSQAQSIIIQNNYEEKQVVFGNEKMSITLDYNKRANISLLNINGQNVIEADAGIYSQIKTKNSKYSSLHLLEDPVLKIDKNMITLSGIKYGDKEFTINESWIFTFTEGHIKFDIERNLSKSIDAEQIAIPVFMFNDMHIWDAAYQDYGGIAWFYLFNKKLDTYGVFSHSSRFWNSKTGNGLLVEIAAIDKQVAMQYSRTTDNKLAYSIAVSSDIIQARFDSGTQRRLFLRDTIMNVWAPIHMSAGKSSQSILLSYFDFKEKFGRGNLVGINEEQVSAVLNTIARIGVIAKEHFGGNSWHTPYGPICLHEQYIAQMGLAINDTNYLKGYQQCLDFYRDNAIKPDGRVWARWAYTNEDAMPNGYTDKGFYEAQWGYLMDANPDYVTNVAELYDQTGDLNWVKTQQSACEKALDWILHRDSNGNGLVEMLTDSHTQKKGSDWIDIIWASYENAFVNAKLYHALDLWAAIEKQLGNKVKGDYYYLFAEKLKTSFNKSINDAGFWDDEKGCYIHWRDKDGSVHGNNMVTPVNFMAIAYGICDDTVRTKLILDAIEVQMQKEQAFFWPLCIYSYAVGEGNDWQFPFPNYENGDIFLSWGSVGVKAYATYKPELALKYVKNVLAQYAKDGLAFQRYGRVKQDGLGDDILSGNSLSVVGLYQAIYGINPKYNRFYLDPHITKELAGTVLSYNYRHKKLKIDLEVNKYSVSDGQFKISSNTDFGFYSTDTSLYYFNGYTNNASLKLTGVKDGKLELVIKKWGKEYISFTQYSKDSKSQNLRYQINELKPNTYYSIQINNKRLKRLKSDRDGSLIFNNFSQRNLIAISVLRD